MGSMSMAADRILPLCELLLGAAYADKELKDQEKDEVRSLLEGLAGELPTEVELKIAQFEPDEVRSQGVRGPVQSR